MKNEPPGTWGDKEKKTLPAMSCFASQLGLLPGSCRRRSQAKMKPSCLADINGKMDPSGGINKENLPCRNDHAKDQSVLNVD